MNRQLRKRIRPPQDTVRLPSEVRRLARATSGRLLLMLDLEGVLASPSHEGHLQWHPEACRSVGQLMNEEQHQLYLMTRREKADVVAALDVPHERVLTPHALEMSDRLMVWAAQAQHLRARFLNCPGVHVEDRRYSLRLHVPDVPSLARVSVALSQWPLLYGWQGIPDGAGMLLHPPGYGHLAWAGALITRYPDHRPVMIGTFPAFEPVFAEVQLKGGIGIRVGRGRSCAWGGLDHPGEVMELLETWVIPPGDPPRDAGIQGFQARCRPV